MKILSCLFTSILASLVAPVASAFDVHTHAAMTSEAFAQSNFTRDPNASVLFKTLGLFDYNFAHGSQYLDIGSPLEKRDGLQIESRVLDEFTKSSTGLTIPGAYTIPGWLMRGAIREDDNKLETPSPIGDEPGGVFNRVYGHFFDPVNNRGLTFAGGELGSRSVDWALLPSATADQRANHFKVADAREAMWRALTLKASDSGGGFNDNVWPPDWLDATKEDLRKAYWATTFRALGDVVHLLQDTAQPQHTRNDLHSGLGCVPGIGCIAGHASFFRNVFEGANVANRAIFP